MIQIYLLAIAVLLLLLVFLNRHYLLRKDDFLQKEFEKKKKREKLAKIAKEDVSEKKVIQKEEENIEKKIKKEEINFNQINSFIKRAETLMAKDQFEESEKLLIQVLSLDENNFIANSLLALLYLKNHSDSKAEVIYRKLLEMKPKDPALYTNLGLAFYNQAKYNEALESYSFAVKLDPEKPARHVNVGQVYFVVKSLDKAIEHFKEAVKLVPRNVEYLFMLADTYREKGELKNAKTTYNKILHQEPYNNEAQEEVRRLTAMGY